MTAELVARFAGPLAVVGFGVLLLARGRYARLGGLGA